MNISTVSPSPQTNPTSETAFSIDGSTRALLKPNGRGRLYWTQLRLRLVYRARIFNASGTLTINIRWNSGANTNLTTFTSDTIIAATTVTTSAGTNGVSFGFLLLDLFLDTQIDGAYVINTYAEDLSKPTFTAWANLLANPAITDAEQMQFLATATYNSSSGNNIIYLTEFALDQV